MEQAKEIKIPEFDPDTHRYDWEKKEVVALTSEELAAIAKRKRKADLESRFKPLISNNVYYIKAFGQEIETINGEKCSIHHSNLIAKWDRDNLDDFEQKVLKLEAAKKEMDDETARNKPMEDRRKEYRQIDELLMEALAEKEENNAEKMTEYLAKRQAIKVKFPK
jgi:non-homologous end joining protein Ku